MKRIIIVRHAKSVHHGYDQDFERTLTDRGRDDAERISVELAGTGISPDLIISSPAARTTQTTKIFAATLGYPAENVRYEKKIYSGMLTTSFLDMLQDLEDKHNTVMVVGHNPTIYYFIESLLPGFSLDVPTCSTVVIEAPISRWQDLKSHSGTLVHRWIPDLL
jgi:phosphohistidine phosphatase